MKNTLVIILIIFQIACSTIIQHNGAEIIEQDVGYGSIKSIKKLASYRVGSLDEYPMLKLSGIYIQGKISDGFLSDCKGEQWNIGFGNVLIFSQDNNVNIAYEAKYKCEINNESVVKFLKYKNNTIKDEIEEEIKNKSEEVLYRQSDNFANRVFEQSGYDRAINFSCAELKMTSSKASLNYEKDILKYVKSLTGDKYSEDIMKLALQRGLLLVSQGLLKVSNYYCQAIDFGGSMYKRF